jgi:hypothetical protein
MKGLFNPEWEKSFFRASEIDSLQRGLKNGFYVITLH